MFCDEPGEDMKQTTSHVAVYCLLYTATFTVNKYVLSVLKFQYPTIFQGWQTLFGLILLKVLSHISSIELDTSTLSPSVVWPWLPYFLTFVVSIYSGSVALSQLFPKIDKSEAVPVTRIFLRGSWCLCFLYIAVPVFMCYHNVSTVIHLLADRWLVSGKILTWKEYLLISAILISGLFISQGDSQVPVPVYLWMALHMFTVTFLVIFPKLHKSLPQLSDNCRLYVSYMCSVTLLLPSTILLGDALTVRQFEFWYYYRFYLGCVLSGVFGVYLSLSTLDLSQRLHTYSSTLLIDVTGAAKLCVSAVSLLLFPSSLSLGQLTWCLLNLCAGTLITDLSDDPTDPSLNSQQQGGPVLPHLHKLRTSMKASRSDPQFNQSVVLNV